MSEKEKNKSIRNNLLVYAIAVILGGAFGFIYWKFVGCASGTCPLTSSPYSSTIMGVLLGGLIASFILERKK